VVSLGPADPPRAIGGIEDSNPSYSRRSRLSRCPPQAGSRLWPRLPACELRVTAWPSPS